MAFGFGKLLPGYGAVIGGALSGLGALAGNRETSRSTAKQMHFQERMSNTAHQRQVKDLRAAGINPILSAKLGGASTPQGGSYTAANVGSAAVQGYGTMASARQAEAQTRQLNVNTKIRQRDLEYLTKSNLSETQLKSKVKELIGQKSMTYIENALSGNTETIPMPYRAPIQSLMQGLREAGLIAGGTGGDIMFKSVDLDGAKDVAKSIAEYLAKTKTLEGIMGQ